MWYYTVQNIPCCIFLSVLRDVDGNLRRPLCVRHHGNLTKKHFLLGNFFGSNHSCAYASLLGFCHSYM